MHEVAALLHWLLTLLLLRIRVWEIITENKCAGKREEERMD